MRPITQAEDAAWQRTSCVALSEILAAHKSLPIIPWTATGGLRLYADISAYADDPAGTFEAWRDALELGDEKAVRDTHVERRWVSGEYATKRGGDKVTLIVHVTVDLPEDEAVTS